MVRRVLGKTTDYISDDDDSNFACWWTNYVDLIPGISGTAVEHDKLVVYYPSKDAQEAQNLIANLRTIVAQEYKQCGSKKTTALLEVRNPKVLLITPEDLCWSLVNWFNDEIY